MIPTPGSVIISSPRHPRPKNRGTHVLNPVHVRSFVRSGINSSLRRSHRQHRTETTGRNRMRGNALWTYQSFGSPVQRALRVALRFLAICSLLLGRIERFRDQGEFRVSIHMNLHRTNAISRIDDTGPITPMPSSLSQFERDEISASRNCCLAEYLSIKRDRFLFCRSKI